MFQKLIKYFFLGDYHGKLEQRNICSYKTLTFEKVVPVSAIAKHVHHRSSSIIHPTAATKIFTAI